MRKSNFVRYIKRQLSEPYKSILRDFYYSYLRWVSSLTETKITPLPKKVKHIPSLRFRYDFFQAAQMFLQVNRIDGSYLEFGSHEVNTFRMALNTLGKYNKPNDISHFWAFDSFSGMPEPEGIDKQKIWRVSMNFTSEENFQKTVRRDAHRVSTVKGFYSDSLLGFTLPSNQWPALVYIDCDYYSSTVDVLNWVGPYLRHGCLIAFDDWDCYFGDDNRGQRLAFREFREALVGKFQFTEFMKINSGGMSFICLEVSKIGSNFEG